MSLIEQLKAKAKKANKRIVLPEGMDERTLVAAAMLVREELAKVTLLGNPDATRARARELNLRLDDVEVVDPSSSAELERFASLYYERMKPRGITRDEALGRVKDPLYFGAMMV
ncbi:MAG TPA: phosphate acyltransferase, partial [Terriglobia bacterium]|nr:phosphate acyltransferase [Terriglobia bacterium]